MQAVSQYFLKNINYYMKVKKEPIIAIIDSGIGGVGVLNRILKKYNSGNYIYYADNLNMPYGNKSKKFLTRQVKKIINMLENLYKVDLIIVACNTASTCLEKIKSNVRLINFNQIDTYLATPLTKKNQPNSKIISDKFLAKQIENHIENPKRLHKDVFRVVKRYNLSKLSHLTLACTHFELVDDIFKKQCKDTQIRLNSDCLINDLDKYIAPSLNIKIILSKESQSYSEKIWNLIRR